jgi:hypothetical protein
MQHISYFKIKLNKIRQGIKLVTQKSSGVTVVFKPKPKNKKENS